MIKSAIVLCFACLTSIQVLGQVCTSERYLSNIFQSTVTQDVVFGNSPALTAVYVAENVTVNQAMTMDVFFPIGDNLPKRPLVMLAYGGGYLFGTKEDEDVWATCDSLAKKGYVTASINYRMNMNVASAASAVRAIYRAAQDYSAAIRFLKENSNTYGIDTNYVFVGGVSAGGFSAMHAVFLDDNERPAATFQSGILGVNPDLGCINCAGNNFNHTTNVRGIINLWGALMDTSYIQQNEIVPMTLFHGTNDLIVPYDYGFPFTALFLMPEVFGSANIAARVENLGGDAELNTFPTGHNIWGLNVNNVMIGGPTEYWNPITDSIVSFLYENIRPTPLAVSSNGVCEGEPTLLMASIVPANGHACWTIECGTILSSNTDSSEISVIWSAAGTYQVSVTSINHLEAYSLPSIIEIEVYALPQIAITNSNGTLEATGGLPYYQWYLNGVELIGENQVSLVPTSNGNYTVQVLSLDGCFSESEPFVTVGISENTLSQAEASYVQIYDFIGRLLNSYTIEELSSIRSGGKNQSVIAKYFSKDHQYLGAELRLIPVTF